MLEKFGQGEPAIHLLLVLAGLLLLLFGRRLFWLALGSLGFLFGLQLVGIFVQGSDSTTYWVASLLGGILGILLAVLAQRLAVLLAGLALGCLVATQALPLLGLSEPILFAGGVLLCGLLGAWIGSLLLDPTLRVTTAAVGALLLLHPLSLPPVLAIPSVGFLTLLGFFAQRKEVRLKR